MDIIYAAMLLTHGLNEQPLVSEGGRAATLYPYVDCTSGDVFGAVRMFTVYADGAEVTTTGDIVNAITACFLMFWLFDIQYPKHFCGLLSLLDNIIYNKKSVRMPQKVSNFINKF
jgi:hypothetical protein